MKKVAVIQDLSSFGKCSLTAAIPVLSVMGVQACPLPTAVLSAQTEFPSYFLEDFTSKMNYFTEEWKKLQVTFDGIYTGFVTGGEQINNIFHFLDNFHTEESMLLVDPIMGDDGEVYDVFSGGLLERMKDLVRHANVVTPNVTECCLLAGLPYEKLHSYRNKEDYLRALTEAGRLLQNQADADIIITGIRPPIVSDDKRYIGNLYIDGTETYYNEMEYNGKSYSGTGDLFASVIMGSILRGENLENAVALAVRFLAESIHDALMEDVPEVEGIHFEKHLRMLL